ncbi:hypothetical protein VQ02_09315 [Methylobacterium variabile]|jgi:uncharacterized protein with HEPN domain|uniref:Nucleotidyltransferase n=1 Tax=Methylobacterium variabile TaxID=298794 RepID=A0A0J6T1K1_9HYPH|nr:HepT-like ribonuclease domain-containing protein [Methylobacterium variabile]KMO39722.1 hypothetical protein VQ02_09315 [Methylobacterium variabile]
MAPREYRHALDDMLTAIDGILRATAGKDLTDYAGDWLLKHGVQRGIEIISEASRAVPADIQARRPEIPWRKIRGIGNVLRHEYHSLADPIIWGIVVDELPPLRTAVDALLSETDPGRETEAR